MNNKDNTPLELEQLLASLEHAGRNQRRQDALAGMIDQMAGEAPSKRPAWRLWLPRVAAVACLIFFILTAVRIWYITTHGTTEGPLIAEGALQASDSIQPVESQTLLPTAPQYAAPRIRPIRKSQPAAPPPQPAATEVFVSKEAAPDTLLPTYPAPQAQEEPDTLATPLPEPAPLADSEPTPAPQTLQQPSSNKQPRNQSIWKCLFRPAEPDLMDGTTLAFSIF